MSEAVTVLKGQQHNIVLLITLFIAILAPLFIWGTKKKPPELRGIAALDAIDEIAGRCAEMNRPIHYTTGGQSWGAMFTTSSTRTLAGLGVLGRFCRACAKVKVKVIYTSPVLESATLVEEIMETAYREEGAEDIFDPSQQIMMKSPYIYAWNAMVLTIITEQNCGGNIVMGYAASSPSIFEAGLRAGAIQVSSQASDGIGSGFGVILSDYAVMGPECYGIGAKVSEEPQQLESLIGQDFGVFLFFFAILIGLVYAQSGNTWWSNLFRI